MVVLNLLVQPAIDIACFALDQFVRGAKSNFNLKYTISIPKIGKFKGLSIPVSIRKTSASVIFRVSGLPSQKFTIGSLTKACIIVVNAAIAVA